MTAKSPLSLSKPIEVICEGVHDQIELSHVIPATVNEFMSMRGIPRPINPTIIRVEKPNGTLAVHVQVIYRNGSIYEGVGAEKSLAEALRVALHDAYNRPQSGPGLPHDIDGLESEYASGHGV